MRRGDELNPWPFVGRTTELRTARAALDGAGVVVCGPAGSGRTAFAAATAPRPRWRVLATPATAAEPLGALRSAIGDDPDDVVASSRGRGAPPILVVDDLDHLDDASLATLHRWASTHAVRLVGVRLSTRPPGDAVSALWRELGLVRLDLPPLGDDDARTALEQALGGTVEGRSAAQLIDLAAGSPYLLRELVTSSVAAGVLAEVDGLWRCSGEPVRSDDVADRVAAELAGLAGDELDAVRALAIAGPIPLEVAEGAVAPAAIEAIEARGIATVDDGDEVALASPLLAAHLRATAPRTTTRRLSGRLADAAVAAGMASPGAPLELTAVVWSLDAGRALPGPDLLAAARLAIAGGDPVLGERLAGASVAADPTTEAVLLQSWCADEHGAHERSRRVLADHRPVGDEATVAIAIRRAEVAFWIERDPGRAEEVLAEAEAATSGPWPLAIAAQRAVFHLLDGDLVAAVAIAEPLVDHETHLVGSTAALALALARVVRDEPDAAQTIAETALERLAGPHPPLYLDPGVHVIALGFALHGRGELVPADELTAAAYDHALANPGRQAQGWAALLRSHVLLSRGRPSAARAVALEAEQIWVGASLQGLARWSATVAAQASAELGDLTSLDACLDRIDTYDPQPFRLFEPEVCRARAWRRHVAGEDGEDGASDALAEATEVALASGRAALAASAVHDLVRIGDADRAAELATSLGSDGLSGLRSRLAAAAAARDAEELEAVGEAWVEAGAHGWAAESLALAAVARPARGAALRVRIDQLLAGSGLATPPLAQLERAASRTGLTAREQEVVALASAGRSNREIAAELVLSLRTVENHLHRAFAKLGVASRSELAGRSS
jgi:DNA-binding CsgD family transcriptional regulator